MCAAGGKERTQYCTSDFAVLHLHCCSWKRLQDVGLSWQFEENASRQFDSLLDTKTHAVWKKQKKERNTSDSTAEKDLSIEESRDAVDEFMDTTNYHTAIENHWYISGCNIVFCFVDDDNYF